MKKLIILLLFGLITGASALDIRIGFHLFNLPDEPNVVYYEPRPPPVVIYREEVRYYRQPPANCQTLIRVNRRDNVQHSIWDEFYIMPEKCHECR